jgi:hypothetical protein
MIGGTPVHKWGGLYNFEIEKMILGFCSIWEGDITYK